MPLLVSSNATAQLAPWLLRCHRWLSYSISIGVVVLSFMFTFEIAGSYLGHVPCNFWKVCLGLSIFHRSIMEGNWSALDVVHASVITDFFAYWACSSCIVGTQQQWYGYSHEKSWWSYRARWSCLLVATMWTSFEPMLICWVPLELIRLHWVVFLLGLCGRDWVGLMDYHHWSSNQTWGTFMKDWMLPWLNNRLISVSGKGKVG